MHAAVKVAAWMSCGREKESLRLAWHDTVKTSPHGPFMESSPGMLKGRGFLKPWFSARLKSRVNSPLRKADICDIFSSQTWCFFEVLHRSHQLFHSFSFLHIGSLLECDHLTPEARRKLVIISCTVRLCMGLSRVLHPAANPARINRTHHLNWVPKSRWAPNLQSHCQKKQKKNVHKTASSSHFYHGP